MPATSIRSTTRATASRAGRSASAPRRSLAARPGASFASSVVPRCGLIYSRTVSLVPRAGAWTLDLDRLIATLTPGTRLLMINSPNNPTGAVYTPEALREVNEICRDRNIYHISDEAYEYFVYEDARHFSPGSIEKFVAKP